MGKLPLMARIDEAKALADEIRVFILDLLSRKPMSVHEIAEELRKAGIYKNINTIRYHLQVLKEAGLIDLVATKEVKGGVLKYYATRRKVYPVEVPPDIEEKLEPVADHMYPALKKLVLEILEEHRNTIIETARSLKPCPYCITRHFAEYIVLESLRIAAGKVLADEDVKKVLAEFRVEEEEEPEHRHHH